MTWRRRGAITGGVLFLGVVLFPVIHHYRLRWAVGHYLAELRVAGEPLDLAQVIPQPLRPEQNSAALFREAAADLATNGTILQSNNPRAMRMVARGKALVGWKQPDIRSRYETNSWNDVAAAIDRDKEALELLGRITNGSLFDFDLQWNERAWILLKHLTQERRCFEALTAAELYDLRSGDERSAVRRVCVMLAIINGTADERTALSQFLRAIITQEAAAATWEILHSTNVSDDHLAQLEGDWSGLEYVSEAARVLPVERESTIATSAQFRMSNADLRRYLDVEKQISGNEESSEEEATIWTAIKLKEQIFLWRYWWSYTDELRALKEYEALIQAWRAVQRDGSFQGARSNLAAQLADWGIAQPSSDDLFFSGHVDFHAFMAPQVATFGVKYLNKIMGAMAAKQAVVAAIALERYRLKHQNYPSNLEALIPDFLSKIPADPVDGRALRYRSNPDGTFLLYSVGENGADDGGNPKLEAGAKSDNLSWQYSKALDWVWPQAASQPMQK